MRRALGPLAALALVACGHAPKAIPGVPVAPVPVVPPNTQPSSDVLDAILPGSEIAGQADVKALRDLPIIRAGMDLRNTKVPVDLLEQIFGFLNTHDPNEPFQPCGFSPITSIQRVAFSERGKGAVLAARFDVPAPKVVSCVKTLLLGAQVEPFGDGEALRYGIDWFVLARGDLVWIGDKESIEAAFQPHELRAATSRLRPTPDTVAAIIADPTRPGPLAKLDARLRTANDDFALDVELKVSSSELARELAARAVDARRRTALAAKSLVDSIDLTVQPMGDSLRIHVAARPGQGRVPPIAAILAMGVFTVRHVQSMLRAGDAGRTVIAIGDAVIAEYEKRHAFPPSAKPMPKVVPKGTRTLTFAPEWQLPGWSDIHYTPKELATYFQYEVVTAPDGKSATVRAHGDQDGDGKESLFEVHVSIGPNGKAVASPLTAKDELE